MEREYIINYLTSHGYTKETIEMYDNRSLLLQFFLALKENS